MRKPLAFSYLLSNVLINSYMACCFSVKFSMQTPALSCIIKLIIAYAIHAFKHLFVKCSKLMYDAI